MIYLMLICILGLVFSCSQEDFADTAHSHNAGHNQMNKVSFEEMQNFIKQNTKGTLPRSLSTILNKGSESYIAGIDSTQITQIVYDGVTTFTLPVTTSDNEKYVFSDLIFNIKNGVLQEYIYHYNPTENWLAEFNAGNRIDYEGDLIISDTNGTEISSIKSTGGTNCFMLVDIPCYGPSCPCSDGNGQSFYVKVDCSGGGGGGETTGDGPTVPTGPGGFGSQDGGGTTDSNLTLYLNNALTRFGSIYALSDQEKSFINNNANIIIASALADYISTHNNAQGAQFVKWAIGFFVQNPNTTWPQFESWFIKGNIDYKNTEDVAFASNLSSISYDLMSRNQAGTLNQLDISWPKMDDVKNKIKEKFKNSIPVAVKYAKHLFLTLKTLTDNYPVLLTYANKGIDKMRNEIHNEGLINYDVHTMKWKDVVGCWLFELGNYPVNTTAGYGNMPTLGFAGPDFVIAGIPGNASQMRFLMNHKTLSSGATSPNSVLDIKRQAINKIKNGNYSYTSGNWGFGFDATIDTISQFDGLQFCLGSYLVSVYVTQINTKTFELTFIVKNKTGWESGTRGLNNGDGNSSNDSVIPDKSRGQGLHLGGTIGETFGWKETITIP